MSTLKKSLKNVTNSASIATIFFRSSCITPAGNVINQNLLLARDRKWNTWVINPTQAIQSRNTSHFDLEKKTICDLKKQQTKQSLKEVFSAVLRWLIQNYRN